MPKYFPYLLASIFAISPLAVDMYLPTLPAIAGDLSVSTHSIAITVSLYILGLGIGNFIGGPISDYKGRRPVLFVGLFIFSISSFILASAASIEIFWLARLSQAIGGGLASVVVPAMIRDRMTGQKAAKLFALISFITIFVPAIAPSIGTVLFYLSGWRATFVFSAFYSAIIFLLCWRFLKMPALPRKKLSDKLAQRYAQVLSNKTAMAYLFAYGLSFSVVISFVANASIVYIEHYQVSEAHFSILFACNIISMMFFNRFNNYLLDRFLSAKIIVWFLAIQLLFTGLLLIATPFTPSLYVVVPLVMISCGIIGGILGNVQTCFMHFFPEHSGIASSLIGSGKFFISAIISGISTQFVSDAIWPMSIAMFVATLIAFIVVPKNIGRFESDPEFSDNSSAKTSS